MDAGKQPRPASLTGQEIEMIRACQSYATQFASSGLPGHRLFLLVAKVSALLEDAVGRFGYAPDVEPPVKVQKVAWDGPRDGSPGGCWRDLVTGVRVEL